MTLIKTADRETCTILDFSGPRCSKNKIRKLLKSVKVESWRATGAPSTSSKSLLFVDNQIKVGIFTIDLNLSYGELGLLSLKDFTGGVSIMIREDKQDNPFIKTHTHQLFRTQYWNNFDSFRIKHLTDVISYLQRLNALKAFL
jgi:hypothetical protein